MIRVFLAAILALVPVTASAVPVLWTISGTVFQNEIGVDQNGFPFSIQPETATVPVTGSFVFDADTQAFSDTFVEVDIALSDALPRQGKMKQLRETVEQSRWSVSEHPLVVSVGGRLFAEASATAENVGADFARQSLAGMRLRMSELVANTRAAQGGDGGGKVSKARTQSPGVGAHALRKDR